MFTLERSCLKLNSLLRLGHEKNYGASPLPSHPCKIQHLFLCSYSKISRKNPSPSIDVFQLSTQRNFEYSQIMSMHFDPNKFFQKIFTTNIFVSIMYVDHTWDHIWTNLNWSLIRDCFDPIKWYVALWWQSCKENRQDKMLKILLWMKRKENLKTLLRSKA